jgi:hypothetical protein
MPGHFEFLTKEQLRAADDALRLLLASGCLTAAEAQCLTGLHWRIQRVMADRTPARDQEGK